MTDSHAEQLPLAQRAHRVERVLDVLRERRRERALDDAVQLAQIGVDKNSTIVFPAPLMSTIGELGAFLSRENAAAAHTPPVPAVVPVAANGDATRA
jgi:hypothetical protein